MCIRWLGTLLGKLQRCWDVLTPLVSFSSSKWMKDTNLILWVRCVHRSSNTLKDYSDSIKTSRYPAILIKHTLLSQFHWKHWGWRWWDCGFDMSDTVRWNVRLSEIQVCFSSLVYFNNLLIYNHSDYTLPSCNKDAWCICLDPVFDDLISITSLWDQDTGYSDVTAHAHIPCQDYSDWVWMQQPGELALSCTLWSTREHHLD